MCDIFPSDRLISLVKRKEGERVCENIITRKIEIAEAILDFRTGLGTRGLEVSIKLCMLLQTLLTCPSSLETPIPVNDRDLGHATAGFSFL